MNNWIRKITFLLATLFASLCAVSAQTQSSASDEAHFEEAVNIYYEGTNEYEFYKAIENYRNFLSAIGDKQKYYATWEKEVKYDVYHNHFRNALKNTEHLKEVLQADNAEDYYYMVDYLMGFFYGMRENNELSKEFLKKAAEKVNPDKNNEALIQIYQTLVNICIFKNLEESLEGYMWAEKAIKASKDLIELSSSLSLKAMVAFGHYDRDTFEKCYYEIEKIRKEHPDQKITKYRKYVNLGRAAYDGDYEKAIETCDSIADEVGRLYFLATIYAVKGDVQSERDTLLKLLRAKDFRNNSISTLTINDLNQDFLLEQERLNNQKTKLYIHFAIISIIALTILLLGFFYFITRKRK